MLKVIPSGILPRFKNKGRILQNNLRNSRNGNKAKNPKRFYDLTTQLIPTIESMMDSNRLLEDIVKVAEKLDDKTKFYMICFYYMTLWEGTYKNVRKNLFAIDECKDGNLVEITETLEVIVNDNIRTMEADWKRYCLTH